MADSSGKWWNQSWNPMTGCTPISTGCDKCWAKRMYGRSAKGKPYSDITLRYDRLEQPLGWRKPRRVAVCLMGDLFHSNVPHDYISAVFHIMYRTPDHFYFVLTKRPERMATFTQRHAPDVIGDLPNVALGISVENQATADERIPHLYECPAAMRFVSIEPMLGPVDLTRIPYGMIEYPQGTKPVYFNPLDNSVERRIDWIIVGSESGPGARPMNLEWVRSIRDQCVDARVPLWFKQHVVNGKRINMPELDGVIYDQMPESRCRRGPVRYMNDSMEIRRHFGEQRA